MQIKSLLVGLTLASGLMAVSPVAAQVPSREYVWSGLYLGGAAGHAWGGSHLDFAPSAFPNERANPDIGGSLIGGFLGYQRQFGALVAGVEASYFVTSVGGSAPDLSTPGTISVNPQRIVMLNGRLGYAAGPALLYATGGYAAALVDGGFKDAFTATTFAGDRWHNGWNVGGGVEWKLQHSVTLGVEYRRIELDNAVHPVIAAGFGNRSFQADAHMDVVMARLSFQLGRSDPVASPLK